MDEYASHDSGNSKSVDDKSSIGTNETIDTELAPALGEKKKKNKESGVSESEDSVSEFILEVEKEIDEYQQFD